jgi:hypothetical protein
MRIHIPSIINFFDNSISKQNSKYSNTVVSLLGEEISSYCFKKYHEDIGATVNVYNIPCKKNGKKGKQLDRWITYRKGRTRILYQTEIKSWNSNSIGGNPIGLNVDNETISRYANFEWNNIWDNAKCNFKSDLISKCLQKMDPPSQFDEFPVQKSLLLYWLPIFDKNMESLEKSIQFSKSTINCEMDCIDVFSVSTYLRYLNLIQTNDYLDIPQTEFPILYMTMEKINSIVKI